METAAEEATAVAAAADAVEAAVEATAAAASSADFLSELPAEVLAGQGDGYAIVLAVVCFLVGLASSLLAPRLQSRVREGQSLPQQPPPQQRKPHAVSETPMSGEQLEPPSLLPKPPPTIPRPSSPPPGALVVLDLIEKHRREIELLRAAMAPNPLFRPEDPDARHDDLFLLRFVLSNPKPTSAAKACALALRLRQSKKLDEVAREVTSQPVRNWNGGKTRPYVHLLPAAVVQPDAHGPAALYLEIAKTDMHEVLKQIPRDLYNHAQMTMMELLFQRMDYATRCTGLLVKYVRVINVHGAQISKVSPRFVKRDADDNKDLQGLYPQLLGAVIFVNPPQSIDMLYRGVIKPMLPRKITDKTLVLSPLTRPADATVLASHFRLDHLPPECGGTQTEDPLDTTEPTRQHATIGRETYQSCLAAGLSMEETFVRTFAALEAHDARMHAHWAGEESPVRGQQRRDALGGDAMVQPLWWSKRHSDALQE